LAALMPDEVPLDAIEEEEAQEESDTDDSLPEGEGDDKS
jgi:hypothetical protein